MATRALIVTCVLVLGPTGARPGAAQQGMSLPSELAWIGLFNEELLTWLENENQLSKLCAEPRDSIPWYVCRDKALEPEVRVIPVRSAARTDEPRIGEIVLVALPGRGLKTFVSTPRGSTLFRPDLFEGDWGYGPWIHQTVLARQGTWFRVPLPSIGTGWIDSRDWTSKPDILNVSDGDILSTPRDDVVVLGVGADHLRVRREQPADMSFCEGEKQALTPWTETLLPFEVLFDAEGHLLVHYKYTRGC